MIRFDGRHGELRFELQEALLADTTDVHQLLDLLEWSILLPVFNDEGGGASADAGQRVQFLDGGGVDVHDRGSEWRFGGSAGRSRRLRGTGGSRAGDYDNE